MSNGQQRDTASQRVNVVDDGNQKNDQKQKPEQQISEGEKYWQMRYERLQSDYDHLQKVNQNLEDKLLNIVEEFERKKEELVANIEYEKSTLMADVNKLSTKLVDARIKLHDYEENEMLHAAGCDSPCHKSFGSSTLYYANKNNGTDQTQMVNDPNLV